MLKNFNAKAFLVDHVEKVGMALIALIVASIWGKEFFAGNWSRETRNPATMLSTIKEKRNEIDNRTWPAERAESFALVDFSEQANKLLSPIARSSYDFSTELFVPLYKPKEKAREPELVVVEDLIAEPGHVVLATRGPETSKEDVPDEGLAKADAAEMDDESGEFMRRGGRGASPQKAGGTADSSLKKNRKGDDDRRPPKAPQNLAGGLLGKGWKDRKDSGGSSGLDDGMSSPVSSSNANVTPEGRFFISVRGVWPVRKQLNMIVKALHLPGPTDAEKYLDLLDFELERKQATAGDDPWSKDWEKIDVQRAMTILDEVDGFDDDPVRMEIVDRTITMELPRRILGEWRSVATHPKISKFELSDEDMQKERELQDRLMEEYEKLRLQEEKSRGPEKRGFASLVNNPRSMASNMGKQRPNEAKEFWTNVNNEMKTRPGPNRLGVGTTVPDLQQKFTAVDVYLLFRYLDFDVVPGFAYRYRVRLTIRNPNYQKEAIDVIDPSVAEGAERTTDWSKSSNVALLPVSPRYFLHGVDRQPMLEDARGSSRRSLADIKLFEWHSKLGTRVASILELTSLGQFLGGEKQHVKVLDVAKEVIEEETYKFSTEDLLVDVMGDILLSPELHPDVAAPKGKKDAPAGLASEMLVIDRSGELQIVEAARGSKEEKDFDKWLSLERREFSEAEKKDPADVLGKGLGGKEKDGKAKKKGDNLRKKKKGGGRKG